jgi:hypothetical protein
MMKLLNIHDRKVTMKTGHPNISHGEEPGRKAAPVKAGIRLI